ncbi:hypothetical protein ACIRBX_03885 [Kitasatospora sp. NPDC096147]|uniref:hypothetical protein n=1 Tax=Kitasatospora sp. NPDC096147 TaxID=3364093 RepID=UPI0038231919
MTDTGIHRPLAAPAAVPGPGSPEDLAHRLIPDWELKPDGLDAVRALPSFASKLRACEQVLGLRYDRAPHAVQDALTLRRVRQLVNTVLLNPLWRSRLAGAGVTGAPADWEDWQRIPLSDKELQRDFFMGERAGMVIPLSEGGFEIVASGGTSSGLPLETVYPLTELRDTYELAGRFMGEHQLARYLTGDAPKWLCTTLADYQMWSSGTMVGGVLQQVPGVNYIGAGPVTAPVLEHMFGYPGPKALMGITAGIAILSELGAAMGQEARESFRVAMYGSGVLSRRKRAELLAVYPNVVVLSYFAATQAETIGLQLRSESPVLAAVPGLHLIEIVDQRGRWVGEGEEGELVVTRLHGHEAPLLRLKLGDRMVRRPRLDGPELRTQQFEFAGRTGEVLHLNDSQYSAAAAYRAVCRQLLLAGGPDLAELAHDVQFVNHRESRSLVLLASVDDVPGLSHLVEAVLGPHTVHRVFLDALPQALSLFNHGEANPASIEKSGYGFRIQLVARASAEIERTAVGKVPLVRDRG